MLHRFVGEELRHEIEPTITEAESVEHQRDGRGPHAHLLSVGGVLLVEPFGDPNLATDLSNHAQMVEMLDDKAAPHAPSDSLPQHGAPPTSSLDLTLPRIPQIGQPKLRNVGWELPSPAW